MHRAGIIALSTWLLWHFVRKVSKPRLSGKNQCVRTGQKAKKHVRLVQRPQPLQSSSPDEVSIVSYNILADSFAKPARLPHARPLDLQWPRRWSALQAEFASLQADILCLQEVDLARWSEMQSCPCLARYTCIVQERDKDALFGNATLYDPRRFTLCWSEHRSRALLTAFTFKDAHGVLQVLYVANLHLEGSPYRPQDRVSQARSALARLAAHMAAHGLHPADAHVVVLGDMNSGAGESVHTLLRRGRLEGGTTEPHLPNQAVTKLSINHPFALQEVYAAAKRPLPFTRKVPGVASSLDWMWASEAMSISAVYWPLTVPPTACSTGRSPMGRPASAWQQYNLPNAAHPSDHLPIGAVLRVGRGGVAGRGGRRDQQHVVHASAEGAAAAPQHVAAG